MPSKFDLGVVYKDLVAEIAKLQDVQETTARAGLSLLSELYNINIDDSSSPTRVKINPRSWVKTTDNRLVLCGARGPSLVEYLEKENLVTKEVLNFGEFTFEMLTLKDETLDNTTIQNTGPTTKFPTCYYIISEEKNLDDWVNSLTWGTMTGNPYSNQHGDPRRFCIKDQAFRRISSQLLTTELIEQGKGWHQNWSLVRRENNRFIGVNLPSLDDSRRAKLYVNKSNRTVPFHWDGENLHIPKYLRLPFRVMRALQTASMKPPEEGWISILNQKPIESRVYSGIDEQLIKLIGEKIVGED